MINIEKIVDPGYWSAAVKGLYRRLWDFNRSVQIEFLEDVRAISDAGVSSYEMYSLFAKTYNGGIQSLSKRALKAINQGALVSTVFIGWFPAEVVTSLRIGEEKGMQSKIIPQVINYLDAGKAGVSLFLKKLVYPLVIMCIAYYMASEMHVLAYPMFMDMAPYETWDVTSQQIYSLWDFILNNTILIILGIVGIYFSGAYVIINYTGRKREVLDAFPVFAQYRSMQASAFLQIYGLLIADLPPITALEEIRKGADPYLKSHVNKMLSKLSMGNNQNAAYLDSGLLTDHQMARLTVLSGANDFDEAISKMGDQTLSKTVKKLTLTANLAGGIGLALAGLAVVSVMLGVMLTAQSIQ